MAEAGRGVDSDSSGEEILPSASPLRYDIEGGEDESELDEEVGEQEKGEDGEEEVTGDVET